MPVTSVPTQLWRTVITKSVSFVLPSAMPSL